MVSRARGARSRTLLSIPRTPLRRLVCGRRPLPADGQLDVLPDDGAVGRAQRLCDRDGHDALLRPQRHEWPRQPDVSLQRDEPRRVPPLDGCPTQLHGPLGIHVRQRARGQGPVRTLRRRRPSRPEPHRPVRGAAGGSHLHVYPVPLLYSLAGTGGTSRVPSARTSSSTTRTRTRRTGR